MPALVKTDNKVLQLAAAQAVTTSWVDLGTVQNAPWINVYDCLAISLFIKMVAGSGVGNKIRIVAKESEDATDEYFFPFEDASANPVVVTAEEKQLSDADQNICIGYGISDNFPFIKFQVIAGTGGSVITAGVTFTSNLQPGT